MKLGPKRIVRPVDHWEPSNGCLATSSRFFEEEKSRWRIGSFYHCRDQFHPHFTGKSQNIIYCHPANEREDIANFIWMIEDRVKVEEHSRIGPTNRNTFTWIKVSPFWLQQSMRRSFFTAILRAARAYKVAKNNFNEALYSVFYFQESRPAVQRFLAGFTYFTGRRYGWHNVFRNKSAAQVATLLTLPPENKPAVAEED